ncbi:MAG: HlyC/CorC family transporter [Candidatus Eisenbacteria bacterium]|nr:HlyC/CorC family transporter [Candidatus Eisenbacteria bacterium]
MSIVALAVIGFAVLLALSAMFSASETAFFSLTQVELSELDPKSRVRRLLKTPEKLLATILLGNTAVNTALGALGALVALHASRALDLRPGAVIAFEVGAVTLVVLIFGEVTPKMFAMQRNRALARRTAPLLATLMSVASPVVGVLSRLSAAVLGRTSAAERSYVTAEELRTIVALSERRGTLDEGEREMIDSVMEFRETVVREIMVPRADMECLEDSTTVGEAIAIVKELGYSRFPVFHGDIDHITGVLYAKDLLPFDQEREGSRSISRLPRKAYFTPETKKAGELLRELQRRRTHIAVVVDEYGGTAGLVTLEDLIEEIVGEIRDEHDLEESPVRIVDERTLLASGTVRLEDLASEYGVNLGSHDDVETLAGYLLNELGRIPAVGESVEHGSLRLEVAAVERRRVTGVRIVRIEPAAQGSGE